MIVTDSGDGAVEDYVFLIELVGRHGLHDNSGDASLAKVQDCWIIVAPPSPPLRQRFGCGEKLRASGSKVLGSRGGWACETRGSCFKRSL